MCNHVMIFKLVINFVCLKVDRSFLSFVLFQEEYSALKWIKYTANVGMVKLLWGKQKCESELLWCAAVWLQASWES